MFFLETSDGERFCTDPKSDDKLEFWKILDQKLGRPTANMFDEFIKDAEGKIDPDAIEKICNDLDNVIAALNNMQNSDITKYVDNLKRISNRLQNLI